MILRYTRLISNNIAKHEHIRWLRSKIPLVFLKQQRPLVILVLSSFVLFIFTQLFVHDTGYNLSKNLPAGLKFGVIVDCGSSGTRAHIFRWREDGDKTTQIEFARDAITGRPLNKHITPGLSTLKEHPDRASEYMEPIMDFIKQSIPSTKHIETPVYFKATAGLRLLDDSIQRKILADITRDLRAKYEFPKIRSQVITGEFEGVYSWLSLNIDKLYGHDTNHRKSYGMIEMGGASTQVTFELTPEVENGILKKLTSNDAISTFKTEQLTLVLGQNRSVKLFTTTFLGLGVNSARESAIDLLVRDYLNGTGELGNKLPYREISLDDPCLTADSREKVSRPSDLIMNLGKSTGFSSANKSATIQVELSGVGNFLDCLTLMERVLTVAKSERLNCLPSKQSCPMSLLANEFIPYQHYPFVGLSEMFFTTNEMIKADGLFNRSLVLHETKRICSTTYNKLLDMYSNGGVSHQDRIMYECFKASWLLTILHKSGFVMPDTYSNFQTVNQIDGREIDWTMGAIVSEILLKKNP